MWKRVPHAAGLHLIYNCSKVTQLLHNAHSQIKLLIKGSTSPFRRNQQKRSQKMINETRFCKMVDGKLD